MGFFQINKERQPENIFPADSTSFTRLKGATNCASVYIACHRLISTSNGLLSGANYFSLDQIVLHNSYPAGRSPPEQILNDLLLSL